MAVVFQILAMFFCGLTFYYFIRYVLYFMHFTSMHIKLNAKSLNIDDIFMDKKMTFIFLFAFSLIICFAFSIYAFPFTLIFSIFLSNKIPSFVVKRKQKKFVQDCENSLDICADIIAMACKSGMSFDSALALYCSKFDCSLSVVLYDALCEWQNGVCSREKALNTLSEQMQSSGIDRFCKTVIHALKHGSPISDLLNKLADEIRSNKYARIEKNIEKAPVKMLIPMCCCILPAMLIFVAGPVLIQFVYSGV